ncbi:MAG: CoA ester lyase [Pseudomonadota bacterium]
MTAKPLSGGRLRSALFAPAVRVDFIRKLPARGADVIILDCEDAVPGDAEAKARARETVRDEMPGLLDAGCIVLARINAPNTPWFADDVAALADCGVAALVLPKVDVVADLDALRTVPGIGAGALVIGLESAPGVADARALLAHPLVAGGYFGAEDFVADMGGVRTPGNLEVLFARSQIALAGRLAGVPVFDQVVTEFGDGDRFEREAREARALGFAGKLCIHPAQVEIANRAFAPSTEERERARRLLEAYDAGLARGVASVDFDGQMVDEALAVQARRLLDK